jgi:hypothetical protein
MLAPGTLLHAGRSSPLAVIETSGWSCACDNVRPRGVRSGLQRSLMTGGQRVGRPDTDRADGDTQDVVHRVNRPRVRLVLRQNRGSRAVTKTARIARDMRPPHRQADS